MCARTVEAAELGSVPACPSRPGLTSPPLPPCTAPQPTLRDSVCLLLLRLLDDRGLLHFEEGATLVKAVNVLMLKILEAR